MRPRSFSARLTWFFVVIVLIPMVAVSLVLFRLVAESERGKDDARLSQAQTAASGLFRRAEAQALDVAHTVAADRALAQAIAAHDRAGIAGQLFALVARTPAEKLALTPAAGGAPIAAGATGPVVAAARTQLVDAGGARAGELEASTTTAATYARDISALTGLAAVITGPGDTTVASTLSVAAGRRLPDHGTVALDGRTFRTTSITAPGWDPAQRLTVRLLADTSRADAATRREQLEVAALLLAFLILALIFALTVARSLQGRIERLAYAARRLGGGDLAVQVPTDGDDDFAAIGAQFNDIRLQMLSRVRELEAERGRLQDAIRRIGDSFAKNLDRDALLGIVVQTAVDGVGAAVGRASVRDSPGGRLTERAHAGSPNGAFALVLDAVEAAVLERSDAAELDRDDQYALSHPLRPSGGGPSAGVVGLISVARPARPFSGAERELFGYLASQAAVSIENVDLHESVRRQAVTDGLTGLFNHRRFQEVMTIEVERAKRFNQPLGLVMLDIDDFKLVNDRHGHLQGDQVLREVARVMLDTSREIDEPARYGGEEMAVALPQTDLDGAVLFAERLRARIEALEVPVVNGTGVVRVTASLGAAAFPQSADTEKDALVAAADSALYRAKRLGKNRVVRAG